MVKADECWISMYIRGVIWSGSVRDGFVRKCRVHGYHGGDLMSLLMLAPSKRYKNAVLRDEADQPQGIKYSCY